LQARRGSRAAPGAALSTSTIYEGDGPTVFAHACKMGLEGIVSKRKDTAFLSSLSDFLLELFLSAALFLSSLSDFRLLAFLRRQPWLLQCFTNVSGKTFRPVMQPRSKMDRRI
jgi:hypothetical protein